MNKYILIENILNYNNLFEKYCLYATKNNGLFEIRNVDLIKTNYNTNDSHIENNSILLHEQTKIYIKKALITELRKIKISKLL